MDHKKPTRKGPPMFFRKLLRWFCSDDLLEELEGDLEETFEFNRAHRGTRYAQFAYVKEVLSLVRPSVIKKLNYNNNSTIMISNYGKVAVRNFAKNKTYVLINMLSMGIGMACCIVSFLNYEHNNTFDHQHGNIENIYRVNYEQQDGKYLRNYGVVPSAIAEEAGELANVKEVTQYIEWHGNAKIKEDYFDLNMGYVSDNFLDVFTFPVIRGTEEAITRKSSIMITEKMALLLFQDIEVVGKTLTIVHQGEESDFFIEGILENIPSNSSFNVDALVNIDNFDKPPTLSAWQEFSTTFLSFDEASQQENIEQHLNEFSLKNEELIEGATPEYYLDPLRGMAARAQANNTIGPLEVAFPVAMEIVPVVISLLILLIACITFANTSIASAASRLKEIGVRKVMGGRKSQVIFQFLGESLLICLFAIIIAIPLSQLLADQYNQLLPFLEIELTMSNSLGLFTFLAALLIVTGIIAGGYPAFYLSKFQPVRILKGNLKYKSVGRLTKVLLSGQFAFSMLAITASILFIKNAQFQNEMDLGFDTEQIIVVRYGGDENVFEPLRSTLAANPKISMIAGSVDHVGRRYHNALITHEGVDINIVGLDVGPNYLETVELELTLGRDFNGDKASDYEEGVIINESLARELATDNPIGQKLVYADTVNYYVIGVVKDFHFDSFQSAIQPLWLRLKKPEEYNYLIAKTNPAMVSSVMSEIKMTWRNLFNTEVRDIKAPDYARNQAQTINGIVLKVLIFMGVVLAIMSIIGFYSLVSLNLFGRMKEIGVRRVLGSSVISVIGVINKDYIWVLLVGTVSGALISYLTIPMLMSTIWSSHIPGNIGLTVFSILLMLLTCAFTVGFRVFFASTVSPTLLLRDE